MLIALSRRTMLVRHATPQSSAVLSIRPTNRLFSSNKDGILKKKYPLDNITKTNFFRNGFYNETSLMEPPSKVLCFAVDKPHYPPGFGTFIKSSSHEPKNIEPTLIAILESYFSKDGKLGNGGVGVFYKDGETLAQTGSFCEILKIDVICKEGTEFVFDRRNDSVSGKNYLNTEVHYEKAPTMDYFKTNILSKGIHYWKATVVSKDIIERISQPLVHPQHPIAEVNVSLQRLAYDKEKCDKLWQDIIETCTEFHYTPVVPFLQTLRAAQQPYDIFLPLFFLGPSRDLNQKVQEMMDSQDLPTKFKIALQLIRQELVYKKMMREEQERMMIEHAKLLDSHTKQEVYKRLNRELGGNNSNESRDGMNGNIGGGGGLGGLGGGPSGDKDGKSNIFRKRLQEFDQKMTGPATGEGEEGGAGSESREGGKKSLVDEHKLQDEEFWKAQELNGGKPLSLPIQVRKVIEEELQKFESLEKHNSEYHIIRNYLDWLTTIPWGRTTADIFDLDRTEKILNEDHYGMDDVKKIILELVAIAKLKNTMENGKIICLVGPPGVGKTSIGKSVAKALNKKFYRFSVGGSDDVTELKGFRRTYVGALPGKIVQMFKQIGSVNPVMMIDEIDKIGQRNYNGNLSHALLELLDPSQNKSFVDTFLDLPLDCSQILFICTANNLSTIPTPLLDRLEVITLDGYDAVEKVKIANKYLDPKLRQETGLDKEKEFQGLTDDATSALAKMYSREAGVRNLSKLMEKIYRKVAYLKIKENKQITKVDVNDLEQFIGRPKYPKENMFEEVSSNPGLVMGLAWNGEGGVALYVEATSLPLRKNSDLANSKEEEDNKVVAGNLRSTGNLGDTMKESLTLAYINAKKNCPNDFLETNQVHLHCPQGGVPKDGPSAGVTMTTALISLATNSPVIRNLAMTGEISLTGLVLPVGGIREKVIAARRGGVKVLILPEANQKEFEELSDHLKKDLDVHFVNKYRQVLKIALPEVYEKLVGSETSSKKEDKSPREQSVEASVH